MSPVPPRLQIIFVLLCCCLPGSPVISLLQGVVEILHTLQGSELALTLSLTKEKYLKLTLHFINQGIFKSPLERV